MKVSKMVLNVKMVVWLDRKRLTQFDIQNINNKDWEMHLLYLCGNKKEKIVYPELLVFFSISSIR